MKPVHSTAYTLCTTKHSLSMWRETHPKSPNTAVHVFWIWTHVLRCLRHTFWTPRHVTSTTRLLNLGAFCTSPSRLANYDTRVTTSARHVFWIRTRVARLRDICWIPTHVSRRIWYAICILTLVSRRRCTFSEVDAWSAFSWLTTWPWTTGWIYVGRYNTIRRSAAPKRQDETSPSKSSYEACSPSIALMP